MALVNGVHYGVITGFFGAALGGIMEKCANYVLHEPSENTDLQTLARDFAVQIGLNGAVVVLTKYYLFDENQDPLNGLAFALTMHGAQRSLQRRLELVSAGAAQLADAARQQMQEPS